MRRTHRGRRHLLRSVRRPIERCTVGWIRSRCTGRGDATATGSATTPPASADDTAPIPRTNKTSKICTQCGGKILDDGFCGTCGQKARSPRDHWSEKPVAVGGWRLRQGHRPCSQRGRHGVGRECRRLADDSGGLRWRHQCPAQRSRRAGGIACRVRLSHGGSAARRVRRCRRRRSPTGLKRYRRPRPRQTRPQSASPARSAIRWSRRRARSSPRSSPTR